MMSSATPGRAFIEVKIRPIMPLPTTLGQICVARQFAWPKQLVGFLSAFDAADIRFGMH